jgi:hypothetical protein
MTFSVYYVLARMVPIYKPLPLMALAVPFLVFYYRHCAHLGWVHFDYAYNMKVNVALGVTHCLSWVLWFLLTPRARSHGKIIVGFCVLMFLFMTLELLDFPPIFWVFDAHSLWHLATIPLVRMYYQFHLRDIEYIGKNSELSLIKGE